MILEPLLQGEGKMVWIFLQACGIVLGMQALQAIILGIVQGLTEFIPVSSSAHLVILPWLFGWDDPAFRSLGFDVALHMGTLAAILVFFWKDWVRLVVAWFKSIAQRKIGDDPDRRMAWYLLAACIPGGIAGVLFQGKIEELFHPANSPILASSMIVMAAIIAALGLLLLLADKFGKRDRSFGAMRWKDALLIGLSQAFAIFPGVSRSGATITAGMALGLERESAARFSFLLSAPIIAGAGLKSIYDLAKGGAASGAATSLVAIGFVAAAASGLICIKFLMDFLKKHTTKAFAFYRWALAILVTVVALAR
jgi:undecaprenyl-diphosphatase